jgi:hypothetical protein
MLGPTISKEESHSLKENSYLHSPINRREGGSFRDTSPLHPRMSASLQRRSLLGRLESRESERELYLYGCLFFN